MKIMTVFKTLKEPTAKVRQVFKTPQPDEKKLKQQWRVWEYKKEKKTNYENHYIYRLTTYSQRVLIERQRSDESDQNPYRWKFYKKVKKIEKTLA